MTIKLTKIVSSLGPLTKRLFLNESGHLQKEAAAQLYRGRFETAAVNNLTDFAELLEHATPDVAFTYGVPDQPSGMIVRDEDLRQHPEAIARTQEFFRWSPGPGILMIDDDSGMLVDSLTDFLRDTVPFLDGVDMLERPSSSSHIKNANTGEWVRRTGNRRVYAIVSDARTIPSVGRLIEAYLWRANCGYFDVSKSGRLLKRCPADTSVFQPERLDFVGGAVCVPPLVQDPLLARFSEG